MTLRIKGVNQFVQGHIAIKAPSQTVFLSLKNSFSHKIHQPENTCSSPVLHKPSHIYTLLGALYTV